MGSSPERTGGPARSRVIINADDFGKDEETVRATIACFEDEIVTSASIMANMPATEEAVAFALQHPELSFGVHLTFVGDGIERPISDPEQVASLVADIGSFLPSKTVRLRALLRQIPVAQIEREATAQLTRIRDMGVPISHVDSHCHVHKFGPFLLALERTLPRFGITRVRAVQDLYITRHYRSPTYWYGRIWRRRVRERFETTDHFFMASDVDDARNIETLLPKLPAGSVEIGGHPGFSGWRSAENTALRTFSSGASAGGHEIIGWHQL